MLGRPDYILNDAVAAASLSVNFRSVRYLWLCLGVVLFLLSLLTLFKAPTLLGWKLALVADEFGYVLLVFALLLAVIYARSSCWQNHGSHVERLTCVVSMLAAFFLAGPPLRGWLISRALPGQFSQAFGPDANNPHGLYWRWTDFLRIHASPTGQSQAYVYSGAGADSLSLEFYPAQNPAVSGKLAPCVVVIHGGGWNNGDRTQLSALNSWLAEKGYAVAAIDYRLAPKWKWPAPREDTEAALRWLQDHASELNINPQQFVLLGRSAGGQIALATGYGKTKSAWRGVISLYGPADLEFAYRFGDENDVLHSLALLRHFLGGTPTQQPAQYRDASPYFHVSSDTPPTLLIHGELDTLVWHKQSERLDLQLAQAKVPHLFISLPWATHAFDINLNGPSGQLTRNAIEQFLKIILSSPQKDRATLGR